MATSTALLAALGFVAMEPITYAVHRWVMHGWGWAWHASHHRPATGRFEANDRFPVVFAALAGAAMATGFAVAAVAWLVPLTWGVSAYGAVYLAVHDLFIHARWRRRAPASVGAGERHRWPVLDQLAAAHAGHHRSGGEPYGMLAPWSRNRRPAHVPVIDATENRANSSSAYQPSAAARRTTSR